VPLDGVQTRHRPQPSADLVARSTGGPRSNAALGLRNDGSASRTIYKRSSPRRSPCQQVTEQTIYSKKKITQHKLEHYLHIITNHVNQFESHVDDEVASVHAMDADYCSQTLPLQWHHPSTEVSIGMQALSVRPPPVIYTAATQSTCTVKAACRSDLLMT
jgi:hypothetical protein